MLRKMLKIRIKKQQKEDIHIEKFLQYSYVSPTDIFKGLYIFGTKFDKIYAI